MSAREDDRVGALEVGAALPAIHHTLTRESLIRYAGASGDFNPIHFSDRIADAMGLPGVIAHGMLTAGLAARVVTEWLGDAERIVGYQLRFTRPVVVPDTDDGVELVLSGTVTAVDDATATITLDARCGDERVLGGAKVTVTRG